LAASTHLSSLNFSDEEDNIFNDDEQEGRAMSQEPPKKKRGRPKSSDKAKQLVQPKLPKLVLKRLPPSTVSAPRSASTSRSPARLSSTRAASPSPIVTIEKPKPKGLLARAAPM